MKARPELKMRIKHPHLTILTDAYRSKQLFPLAEH